MSQTACCVPGCSSTYKQGIPLYRFPNPDTETERFRTWVIKIGGDIVGLDNHYIYKNRRVCSLHFNPVYIYTRKLSKLAIPQLCLPGVPVHRSHLASIDLNVVPLAHDNPMTPPEVVFASTSQENITSSKDVPVQMPHLAPNAPMDVNVVPLAHNKPLIASEIVFASTSQQNITCSRGKSVGTPLLPTSGTTVRFTTRKQKTKTQDNLNKEERSLSKTIIKYKKRMQKLQNSNEDIKKKLALTKKMINSQAYDIVTKRLDPKAKLFFAMQIRQALKKTHGRRFTIDEKMLAMSLYKPSPKAYKALSQICILPHRRTLDKVLHNAKLSCGVNNFVFDHLKQKVKKMPISHRYCSIIFDEMAITAQLTYKKKDDVINGFCDDGKFRTTQFCDHALVFMVRGIYKKYKQPIAYSLCSGSTKTLNLVDQLTTILKIVQETGLIVITTVSDQGATNIAAIYYLIENTKQKYLKCNQEWRGGFYEIDNKKNYHIFDPPHLIKGIRNNLLNKNLHYKLDNQERVAKWSHIEALLRRGPKYKGCKMGHKLTDQHVVPHKIPKMRVKMATQVFSHSVGTTLGFMAEIGKLPAECTDTADLLLLFDELFDSVNGSYNKPDEPKIYRTAITPKSPHHKLWKKYIPVLKSMSFVSPNGQKCVVPSIKSWISTIETFENISADLDKRGLTSLLLRNFNQDPLENFFGAIRAHGQNNIKPDAVHFINSFKILLVNSVTSKNAVGTNCENDDTKYLQSLKSLLTLPSKKEIESDHDFLIEEDHLNMELIDTEKIIKSKDFDDQEKCAAAAYCCGWLINVSKKKFKKCMQCKSNLECKQEEEFHRFISLKKYSASSWLHYPTRELLDFFLQIENITYIILKNHCNKTNIATYIKLIVEVNIDYTFLQCQDHKNDILNFLLDRSVNFFINNYVKEINNLLSGKVSNWDQDDGLKNMAHNYYLKHKKK